MRSGPTRHSFDGFGSPRPPRRCARRRARKEPRARALPGSRAARLLAWPRPDHCGDAAARLRPVTHQRRERLAGDLPSPEPFHAAVGGPSPQLVADSLASRAGGRVAGAEHAVRPGLLPQRGVAPIERRTVAHRLDGDFGGKRFGDTGYAREELVAELGTAFLCADLGI